MRTCSNTILTQGRYALCDKVEAKETAIVVDGKEITIYAEKDAKDLPWGKIGVDVVLECSGFYASKEKASAHIAAGARKVVISAPAGNDLPTIVYSVNEKTLKPTDTVISAASCTTNCLAPMADTLNKLASIEKGFMTTIHAYTGDQMLLRRSAQKGRPEKSESGRAQYRSQFHRRCEGYWSCYSRACRQARRRCSACSHSDRFRDRARCRLQ